MNHQNAENNTLRLEVTEARDELLAAGLANAAANAATATAQAAVALGHANTAAGHKDAAAASAAIAAASATSAGTAATAAATTLISAVTQRPAIKPAIAVDWTLKPTAAALTAAGWTISRTGEITAFGPAQHKAAENLFVRSRDFGNAAWTKTALAALGAVTHSSGLVGSTVAADGTLGFHALRRDFNAGANLPSQQHRVRFLVKAGAYSKCLISNQSTNNAAAAFDLAGGTTITLGGGNGPGYVSHSITPHELGGGLYWVELRLTTVSSGDWSIGIVGYPDGSTLNVYGATYTGDGTSGIEVYAAQLVHVHETDYDCDWVETTDTPVTLWTPKLVTTASNELAYQHNSRGECLGLVNYPAATNVCLRSQDLGHAAWIRDRVNIPTVTKRFFAGGAPFWRVSKSNTEQSACLQQITSGIPGAGSTWSSSVALLADPWTGTASVDVGLYGLENGAWGADGDAAATILSGPGTLSKASTGALYRISGLSTTVPTVVRLTRIYQLAESGGLRIFFYPGTFLSTALGAAILATRVQVESGPRATPYIPTTSATVTRGAQTVELAGAAFAAVNNPAEGTLLARASVEDLVFSATASAARLDHSASAAAFDHSIGTNGATAGVLAQTDNRGTAQAAPTVAGVSYGATPLTAAYSYAANSFQAAAGGAVSTLDTSGTVPAVNRLATPTWIGLIQRTELYPRAMTAAELTAITTPGVLP